MTDGQIALLVLVLFTLYEGTRWLPARTWAFQSPLFGKKWRGKPTWETVQVRGGGFIFLNPLPPPNAHLTTASWPCFPTEKHLCILDDENTNVRHLPWDKVQVRCEESVLYIGPEHRVQCVNSTSAQTWAAHLLRWKGLDALGKLRDFAVISNSMLDAEAVAKNAKEISEATSDLRFQGLVILLWTFGLLPYVYWLRGDSLPSYIVLGGLVCMMFVQAFQLWRIASKHPELRKQAISHIFGVALFPPSSIRAADWVCGSLSKDVHPLIAHKLWSPEIIFLQEASTFWRQARWPKGEDSTEQPSHLPDTLALKAFFEKHNISLSDLEAPPPMDGDSTQYCPRCRVTYTSKVQYCADCKSVPLKSF